MDTDWQDRVKQERYSLTDKIIKLSAFMEDYDRRAALKTKDLLLLWAQLRVMKKYAKILDKRINRFPKESDK